MTKKTKNPKVNNGKHSSGHMVRMRKKKAEKQTKKIIEESVEALVMSRGNIAKASRDIGITESSMRYRMANHKEIALTLKRIPDTAKIILETSAIKASETVTGLMDSKNERIQFDSATDVLDRVGVVKPDVSQAVQVNVFNKIKEDIDSYDV